MILSGGMDSAGVAAYWKKKGFKLFLLTFNYGQRAKQELRRALEIGKKLEAGDHKVIDISFMKELYGPSNVLTDESKTMPSRFQSVIVVPVRNAIFLSIGAAYAFSISARTLAYGAHLTDKPYPDCRPEFAKSLSSSLNLGDIDAIKSGKHPRVSIWSPAVAGMTKDELLKNSYRMLGSDIFRTWSCYLDGSIHCGTCESCNNRKKAFSFAGIEDLTKYRN